MARIIGAVYNGLIWAGVITLLCVNSVVICMRINMGTLFLISFVGTAALLWIISFLKKWKIGALFSILNLAVCGLSADLQQGSSDKAGFYPAACPSQTGTSAGAGQWSDPGSAGRGISGGTGSRPSGKKKRDQ